MSFANTQYECNCISTMIKYYKWLFQVDEEEEKKEEVCMLWDPIFEELFIFEHTV